MTSQPDTQAQPPADEEQPLTPSDIADGIRRELATIRKHWAHTFDPPRAGGQGGPHGVPDSRFPGNDTAISLRAEVTRDLAFWVHAVIVDHPDTLDGWGSIDAIDVERTCRFLSQQADQLGEWEFGNRLWAEIQKHARNVKQLASPPVRDSMPIGECPVEVDGPYGPETCGGTVRVQQTKAGATCPKCKTWAVLDWWYAQIMGNPEAKDLVTARELVTIAAFELSVVVQQSTLRKWVERGTLKADDRKDGKGRALFDRRAAMAVIRHRTAVGTVG